MVLMIHEHGHNAGCPGQQPAAEPGQPPVATLVDGIRRAGRVERGCYLLAVALMVSGLVHLRVLVVSGGSWSGPLSWRKPATFGLSFGLTLATVTWVLSFRRYDRDRGR